MDRTQAFRVPLIDLKAQYRSLKEGIDSAVARVLGKGNYVMGDEVEAFEHEWGSFCGRNYCVGVSSGSDAIYLALKALEVVDGPHPVRAPAFTFWGTVEPVWRVGENAYLVDVDDDANMLYEDHINHHCVMLPVYLYGRPVHWIDEAVHKGHIVIEDMAQAHGIRPHGTVGCFSFYPTKNLGAAGQGGAVVTDNKELADIVRSMRDHGERGGRFRHEYLSGNHRLDEIQAAILRVKLPHLREWNTRRRAIAMHYNYALRNVPGITIPAWDYEHVWHIYAIRCPKRDGLATYLEKQGIQTAVRYPIPIHQQPAFEGWSQSSQSFPSAEAWARETLSLPIYPEMTDGHIEYVEAWVTRWCKEQYG